MTSRAADSRRPVLLDVHHHMVPPIYREVLAEKGQMLEDLPEWTPERSLGIMDRCGIGKALVTVPPPGVWFGDGEEARRLARACNEYGAGLAENHPDRFGALAVLPLSDLEGARSEVEYALDTLELDGIILFSNVQGMYVGDPELDPIMAELADREASVFLHPNAVPGEEGNLALYPWAEFPIDVGRAWARLILNDTLVRYPGIRWILGHAGGVVPFMAERLGKAHYAKPGGLRWLRILKDLALKKHGGLELAKGVSYDTVGAANPVTYAALRQLAGPDRLRFGSNFPFESEEGVEASIRFLSGREGAHPSSILQKREEGVGR